MPRFYFHIREGTDLLHDGNGWDFPDLGAARREAVRTARGLLNDMREVGATLDRQSIEICDETGATLDVVAIKEGFRA